LHMSYISGITPLVMHHRFRWIKSGLTAVFIFILIYDQNQPNGYGTKPPGMQASIFGACPKPGLIGRVVPGRASSVKMVGIAEMGAPISLVGVAVHPDCWCVCLCYLHFAPENPEDGDMYLLVPAHLGCPGQSPESCKMIVYVCDICKINTD